MNYAANGAGGTFGIHNGAGRRRTTRGAGLTFGKPFGAGAIDPQTGYPAPLPMDALRTGLYAVGGLLAQYFIIKYAVRAARKK